MFNASLGFIATLSSLLLASSAAISQVIPDTTLGDENSSVLEIENANTQINGGAQREGNLFHSFSQFSISKDFSAHFNNLPNIDRIFARVTGENLSTIDGLISANGDADLYLINPSGIDFLPNAALSIGGSFVGTTANFIEFADGKSYPATIGQKPLLTNTVPVGIGLSGESSVSVLNSGHSLEGNLATPLTENTPNIGLSVVPGRTIALLGGNIAVEGGITRAPDGHIELGAVQEGLVRIDSNLVGFEYAVYEEGDIQLSQRSLVDTRGPRGGTISLIAEQVAVADGSILYTSSLSDEFKPTGIDVHTENLSVGSLPSDFEEGVKPEAIAAVPNNLPTQFSSVPPSALLIDNYGAGISGDLLITANNLSLANGGLIYQRSFASGAPGNISVSSQSISLDAPSPLSPGVLSAIAITNFGPTSILNDSFVGNISIDTTKLRLLDGGFISTSTIGQGSSGNIFINAEDILVSSTSETLLIPSSISSGSLLVAPVLPTGSAGEITINTDSLEIFEGGTIISSSNSLGNAGSITIQANDFVEIDGVDASNRSSQIGSEAIKLSQPIRDFFNLESNPTGDAGQVSIKTPSLILSNGGEIGVRNAGLGNAGEISVDSDSIQILSTGQITANTGGGNGGDIDVMSNSLLIGEGSSVTTSAVGQGQGGNITIDSDGIALLPNSSIMANAEQGAGGRIVISTDALLQSPESIISASSEAGAELNGSVEIQADEAPNADGQVIEPPGVELPQIAAACADGADESEFTVTGRGGLPASPDNLQQSTSGWRPNSPAGAVAPATRPSQVIEAQGWLSNGDGTISFTDRSTNLIGATAQRTACVNSPVSQNRT
jgi:filamentous hemagglutinin family protein